MSRVRQGMTREKATTIAEYLHAYEVRHALTDEEVADLVGVHQTQISRWKRGVGVPRSSYLPALAEVLDVDVDELEAAREASEELRAELAAKRAASPTEELAQVRAELRAAKARIKRLEAKLKGE